MTMRTYTDPRIDRSAWGEGPWSDEPDKMTWTDEKTGLPCIAKRHPGYGHWCGYVGVHQGHALHGKDYGTPDVEVHGGLTYSDSCQHGDPAETICHIPEPGEADDVWWFGFDCHHCMDFAPGVAEDLRSLGLEDDGSTTYRTLDFVRLECARLARGLKAAL